MPLVFSLTSTLATTMTKSGNIYDNNTNINNNNECESQENGKNEEKRKKK